jgi:quercetin dioxygenase-like cupin family protein
MNPSPIIRAEHDPPLVAVPSVGNEARPQWRPLSLDVDIRFAVVANVAVVMNVFRKAGDSAPGHRHHFDHLTLLTNGRASFAVNGAVTEYAAPAIIIIPKDAGHQITAMEDGTTLWCVHAARDIDGEVLAPDAPADTRLHAISKGL